MKLSIRPLHISLAVLLGLCGLHAHAFSDDFYARESVLAQGKWVKIHVNSTGMQCISRSQLQQWGFSDPSKVKVYGYGALAISDVFSAENFVDDLPETPSVVTQKGLVFYGIDDQYSTVSTSGAPTHRCNTNTTCGYYFLTEGTPTAPTVVASSPEANPATTARSIVFHELDQYSPGSTGTLMVGEDFNYTRSRQFSYDLTDIVTSESVTMNCSFLAAALSTASTVRFTVNGTARPATASNQIAFSGDFSDYYGNLATITDHFTLSSSSLALTISFSNTGSVYAANLNYLEFIYTRSLSMASGKTLDFFSSDSSLRLSGSGSASTNVWDVTNPLSITAMALDSSAAWGAPSAGLRHYVAWDENSSFGVPTYVESVANQSLHSAEPVDMIIFAPKAYISTAEKLANMHRTDPLDSISVRVIDIQQAFNEFSSGAFDPNGLRRCMKMFYDRGTAAGHPLRFTLMMGKGTYDNRQITVSAASISNPMPLWVSEASLSESSSFTSDDYFAFLEDGSGQRPNTDRLSVAVGRIPCTSVSEAEVAVTKLINYRHSMKRSPWRNHVVLLADDENQGIHMTQTEKMWSNMSSGSLGQRLRFEKIYIDAYTYMGGTYPQARTDFYNALNDGTLLWCYVGHGSPNGLSGELIVTTSDVNSRFYLDTPPFCYAATCSFVKWDTDAISSAEKLMFNADGGLIGTISALRSVYITLNGNLSAAFGTAMAQANDAGGYRTMGEVYQSAKNNLGADTNRLRYVYLGDPAMHLAIPDNYVQLDSVNSVAVTDDEQTILQGRQKVTLSGTIRRPSGEVIDDFNGVVTATLYDAETSVTTNGRGEGEQITYDTPGALLFTAHGTATAGRFTLTTGMPSEMAQNFRPATLNLYAYASDTSDERQAVGIEHRLYAYGEDYDADDDDEAPLIHSVVLNHSSFREGDAVNADPMVIASVSDNVAINLSTAGIGHQMTICIDGQTTYGDVASSFTPDITPTAGEMSGTIAYQIPDNLDDGTHEMRLRVWDTSGNVAEQTLQFTVNSKSKPKLVDVYADANPASTSTNFYVTHDRPGQRVTVDVTVYNLLGQPVWSSSATGRSDLNTSTAVKWDLTDSASRRVQRGIYLYRATLTDADGTTHVSASRKIAVTAQ